LGYSLFMRKIFSRARPYFSLTAVLLVSLVFPGEAAAAGDFSSLTGMRLFSQGASAGGMSAFLNLLYQYLIGIAIILAVVEIIWGGFLIMGSGASVAGKSAGKNKIVMALAGLVLVLSPYLVFSLINPGALSLQIGTNNLQLSPTPAPPAPTTQPSQPTCPKSGINCVQKTTKGVDGPVNKFTTLYSCAKSDCASASKACGSNFPRYTLDSQGVVCVQSDGKIDLHGRTWRSYLPGTAYTCNNNEKPAVRCVLYWANTSN